MMFFSQVVQLPVPPTPPDPGLMLPPFWVTMPPGTVGLIFLGLTAAAVIVLWPIMRAIGRRLEGRGGADAALRAEVEQLRARLSDVDLMHQRLAELEERVDFAERLLAQRKDIPRLEAEGRA